MWGATEASSPQGPLGAAYNMLLGFSSKGQESRGMHTPIFGLGESPEVVNPRYFWHATGGKAGSGAG